MKVNLLLALIFSCVLGFTQENSLYNLISGLKAEKVMIDRNVLNDIIENPPKKMSILIPFEEGNDTLVMIRDHSISNNLIISTNDNKEKHLVGDDFIFFKGYLKGDENSYASFTFSENQGLSFLIQDDSREYTIHKNENNQYIFHEDIIKNKSNRGGESYMNMCGNVSGQYTNPNAKELTLSDYQEFSNRSASSTSSKIVNIYIEVGYDIYQSKGSKQATINFVSGLFSNTAKIYENDGIYVKLSEVRVWERQDPYSSLSTMNQKLYNFTNDRKVYNGNVAVFIDLGGSGGLAWVDGLCDNSYSQAYAGIRNSYLNYPNYSWSVNVLTHEIGHVLGSDHTQSCSWPNGAIDGCVNPEGSCARGPIPSNGGTIMSYCHVLSNVGVNFENGFGYYPRQKILSRINSASCLEEVENPSSGSYCTSKSNRYSDEYIGKVKLNTINNSSSGSYYSDYTSISTDLNKGENYSIEVTPVFPKGILYKESVTVWIDYNQDNDFDDEGEKVWVTNPSTNTPVSGSFNVPSTAKDGTTRMRVTMKFEDLATPCETFADGEVEDYTVNIQSGGNQNSCSGYPNYDGSVYYNIGDRVVYQGALYELSSTGAWVFITSCNSLIKVNSETLDRLNDKQSFKIVHEGGYYFLIQVEKNYNIKPNLHVIDMNGNKILSKEIQINEINNRIELPIKSGVYTILIEGLGKEKILIN